jgi:hypothetical protein
VVANPALGAQRAREDQAKATAAGRLRRVDGGPATAVIAAVVTGVGVVVLTHAEEPDEPQHEQADVENPEADHEDPALRTHMPIVPR